MIPQMTVVADLTRSEDLLSAKQPINETKRNANSLWTVNTPPVTVQRIANLLLVSGQKKRVTVRVVYNTDDVGSTREPPRNHVHLWYKTVFLSKGGCVAKGRDHTSHKHPVPPDLSAGH